MRLKLAGPLHRLVILAQLHRREGGVVERSRRFGGLRIGRVERAEQLHRFSGFAGEQHRRFGQVHPQRRGVQPGGSGVDLPLGRRGGRSRIAVAQRDHRQPVSGFGRRGRIVLLQHAFKPLGRRSQIAGPVSRLCRREHRRSRIGRIGKLLDQPLINRRRLARAVGLHQRKRLPQQSVRAIGPVDFGHLSELRDRFVKPVVRDARIAHADAGVDDQAVVFAAFQQLPVRSQRIVVPLQILQRDPASVKRIAAQRRLLARLQRQQPIVISHRLAGLTQRVSGLASVEQRPVEVFAAGPLLDQRSKRRQGLLEALFIRRLLLPSGGKLTPAEVDQALFAQVRLRILDRMRERFGGQDVIRLGLLHVAHA